MFVGAPSASSLATPDSVSLPPFALTSATPGSQRDAFIDESRHGRLKMLAVTTGGAITQANLPPLAAPGTKRRVASLDKQARDPAAARMADKLNDRLATEAAIIATQALVLGSRRRGAGEEDEEEEDGDDAGSSADEQDLLEDEEMAGVYSEEVQRTVWAPAVKDAVGRLAGVTEGDEGDEEDLLAAACVQVMGLATGEGDLTPMETEDVYRLTHVVQDISRCAIAHCRVPIQFLNWLSMTAGLQALVLDLFTCAKAAAVLAGLRVPLIDGSLDEPAVRAAVLRAAHACWAPELADVEQRMVVGVMGLESLFLVEPRTKDAWLRGTGLDMDEGDTYVSLRDSSDFLLTFVVKYALREVAVGAARLPAVLAAAKAAGSSSSNHAAETATRPAAIAAFDLDAHDGSSAIAAAPTLAFVNALAPAAPPAPAPAPPSASAAAADERVPYRGGGAFDHTGIASRSRIMDGKEAAAAGYTPAQVAALEAYTLGSMNWDAEGDLISAALDKATPRDTVLADFPRNADGSIRMQDAGWYHLQARELPRGGTGVVELDTSMPEEAKTEAAAADAAPDSSAWAAAAAMVVMSEDAGVTESKEDEPEVTQEGEKPQVWGTRSILEPPQPLHSPFYLQPFVPHTRVGRRTVQR